MKLTPHVIDAMLSAGCTAEQIGAAVKAAMREDDESQSDRRERDRIRKREQRAREKGNENNDRVRDVTRTDADGEDTPPSPDKEKCPKEINPTHPCVVSSPAREGFDRFWSIYPHKVGKRDALKAFERATTRAPLETIFAGLKTYVAKTDDRPWCNPATWLNQDRWDDAPATVTPQARGSPSQPKTVTDVIDERLKRYERPDNFRTIDADFTADGDGGDPPALHRLAAASRY